MQKSLDAACEGLDFAGLFARSGLDWNALARGCGYRNLDKGRRRLRDLAAGDLSLYPRLREALAQTLGLEPARLDAVAGRIQAHERERRRQAFAPHIIWITDERPANLGMAVLSGMAARLCFRTRSNKPLEMLVEALDHCPDRIPLFGKVIGFHLCHAFGQSIRFDRKGNPVAQGGEVTAAVRAAGKFDAMARLLAR